MSVGGRSVQHMFEERAPSVRGGWVEGGEPRAFWLPTAADEAFIAALNASYPAGDEADDSGWWDAADDCAPWDGAGDNAGHTAPVGGDDGAWAPMFGVEPERVVASAARAADGSLVLDAARLLAAPSADWLEHQDPGPELSWRLAAADPEAGDDYAVVELIAAWTRLASWAQAGAARAAAALADRASQIVPETPVTGGSDHPRRARRTSRVRNVAAHEIAMRLCITRDAAQTMIDNGRALTGPLWPVGDALTAGHIDLTRARAFVTGLDHVPTQVAIAVQDQVLPTAPRRTARQVTGDIARALIAVDPHDAEQRHQRARTERKVCHPTPLPHGMAGMWCVFPAVDATALDLALDAAATAARADGDPRTTDQLRADLLATIGHSALTTGWFGTPPPDWPHAADRTPDENDGQPGDGDRRGSRTNADHERTGSGPGTTAPAPGNCFRLGQVGGRTPHIRVIVPLAVLLPDAEHTEQGSEGNGSEGNGSEGNGSEGSDSEGNGSEGSDSDHSGQGSGNSPYDPLAHSVDPTAVAELDGYGPITPAVARAIALGGTWTRLVTDPESGLVRDIGRTRYRPPAELAELVRTRDRTCTRPGCGAGARTCDLDHTIPYHHGGHTADTNLGALCPTDHAMKSSGGYRVRQVRPGVFDFHLPSGHTYRREPDGTSTLIGRRTTDPNAARGTTDRLGDGREPRGGESSADGSRGAMTSETGKDGTGKDGTWNDGWQSWPRQGDPPPF